MKTEVRTVMVPKEKAFWVADDGTKFEKMIDCIDYELECYCIQHGKDLIECKKARNHPYGYGMKFYEQESFRWVKPLNAKGIEFLNRIFSPSDDDIVEYLCNDDIGQWFCATHLDEANGFWFSPFSYIYKFYTDKMGLLEPKRYERSGYVTETCPNCEAEVEMKWDVEEFGYKAYCPHCGQRLMLCDECLHPNGECEDNCDYCTETDSCRHNKKNDREARG